MTVREATPAEATDSGVRLVEVVCPLCGCGRWTQHLVCRDLLYGVPGEFQLVRCSECRHVYLNPQPAVDDLPRCYPRSYVPHEKSAEPEPPGAGPWYLSRAVRAIPGLRGLYYWLTDTKSWFVPGSAVSGDPRQTAGDPRRAAGDPRPAAGGPRPTAKRALEIGCATGEFLARLAGDGWTVRGVELSPAAAERARSRGFDVHTGTLESAGFQPGAFDAVFAWMVVEHLADPRAALAEVHRVLVPRGWFAFSVPNFGCWEPRVFGCCWPGYDLPRHLQHFTVQSLRRLLQECGFEVERVLHQPSVLYCVGGLGLWLRERFPRRRLGEKLVRWFLHNPPLWVTLALAPAARLQALLRQSGRLTVLARRAG